nr:hypothetical protein [Bacilli bacterium]
TAISAIANTVKEATAYLSPFMMVFMMLGILPAIIGTHFWTAFVPILNLSACMHALLMGSDQLLLIFTVTVGVNIFLAAIMMFFITKLFEKENVVLGN